MIGDVLSGIYGAVATRRRRWYAPASRQRQLRHPVISVGNLRVGGSGKTPVTDCIARLLITQGERPAILSRGYKRQRPTSGVTVVSDPQRVLADVAHAGDEPLLLANLLPGVPVLVCADRYTAGLHAERQFGVTVHLLDDGFQHVKLARDIDLLLVDSQDMNDRVLPAGRLREPLSNASVAHGVIVPGTPADARAIAATLAVDSAFTMIRSLGTPWSLREATPLPPPDAPVLAVAAIAKPERFFEGLVAAGYHVSGTLQFPDHHVFRPTDLARIIEAARASGASAVFTTEKDAVRLVEMPLVGVPFAAVPLLTRIEPADQFASWLAERLARARASRSGTVA